MSRGTTYRLTRSCAEGNTRVSNDVRAAGWKIPPETCRGRYSAREETGTEPTSDAGLNVIIFLFLCPGGTAAVPQCLECAGSVDT